MVGSVGHRFLARNAMESRRQRPDQELPAPDATSSRFLAWCAKNRQADHEPPTATDPDGNGSRRPRPAGWCSPWRTPLRIADIGTEHSDPAGRQDRYRSEEGVDTCIRSLGHATEISMPSKPSLRRTRHPSFGWRSRSSANHGRRMWFRTRSSRPGAVWPGFAIPTGLSPGSTGSRPTARDRC